MLKHFISSLLVAKPGVVFALAMTLLLGAGIAPAQAQTTSIKIAVVDLEIVVAGSEAGKQLQAKLEAFQNQAQEEGKSLNEKGREIQRRIAEGANSLADDKLAELQKQYEDATIALRRFRDDKQREGQKMQTEGLREIERQLEPIFKQIQERDGYDLILNNVPGVVVMANENVDITAQVIDLLNAKPADAGGR